MTRSSLLTGALCALLLPSLGCNLLNVSDTENAKGRGARVFDPYQASASGAIRLALTWYNGCAILPNGQTVAKNSTPVPYPDTCQDPAENLPLPNVHPPAQLQLLANTTYFLNQFTVTDAVVNLHTSNSDLSAPLDWITHKSRFKSLDWGGVGETYEDWQYFTGVRGATQRRWNRLVYFDNANWRRVQGDSFKVEILDSEGTVRGTPVEYLRSEFLAENPQSGHTAFTWRMEGVNQPRFPNDTEVNPLSEIPGWAPQAPKFRTIARMDLFGSTNPFKTFDVPDLRGDGALRITWSQMPDEPFFFPVTFVAKEDVPPTCYDDAGNQTVQCGFGLNPDFKLLTPANGQYYEPGEVVNLFLDLRDGDGNRLHHPDELPSSSEMNSSKANGLVYASIPVVNNTLDLDQFPFINIAGPIQNLLPSNPKDPLPFFAQPAPYAPINEGSTFPGGFGEMTPRWNTRWALQLPKDAKPGTYVAMVKWNRYFMGERVTKTKPVFFQVGTTEKTRYPGRVGNCQMCHRGVLSLDNLRHGLSVDHVEACKSCHFYESQSGGYLMESVHKIHMRSPKFPMPKNDCTLCHLQRESATRPSIFACTSCHPSAHGDQYFAARYTIGTEPSRYGNCAQQCHGDKPPQLHILPQ